MANLIPVSIYDHEVPAFEVSKTLLEGSDYAIDIFLWRMQLTFM
jgi:hypothetical protein